MKWCKPLIFRRNAAYDFAQGWEGLGDTHGTTQAWGKRTYRITADVACQKQLRTLIIFVKIPFCIRTKIISGPPSLPGPVTHTTWAYRCWEVLISSSNITSNLVFHHTS